MKEVFIK